MWRIFGALSLFLITVIAAPSANARQIVPFSGFSPGTVVVKTHARSLYCVVGDGRAVRYPVGVAKVGMTWSGSPYIQGKYVRPAWSPPEEIRRDKPCIADVIPSGSSPQSDGCGGVGARPRPIRHSRHKFAGIDRPLRVLRLHPHV
jgi:lipoprotein-anchoring transpeptidase ErfK/SrfK